MVDEAQENTEVIEEEKDETEQKPEPETTDPRDAKIQALETENQRQRSEMIDFQARMDEAEELLANPPEPKTVEQPARSVDYNELDQNQFAATLKTEIAKEVGRIFDEKEAPRLQAQSVKEKQDSRKEEVTQQREISVQVSECSKLDDWERYKPEIQRVAEEFQAEFGMKALVKSNLIKKTYSDMRVADAKKRVKERSKSGSTSEKPGASASAAEAPKTMESAFDEAWEKQTQEEKDTVS